MWKLIFTELGYLRYWWLLTVLLYSLPVRMFLQLRKIRANTADPELFLMEIMGLVMLSLVILVLLTFNLVNSSTRSERIRQHSVLPLPAWKLGLTYFLGPFLVHALFFLVTLGVILFFGLYRYQNPIPTVIALNGFWITLMLILMTWLDWSRDSKLVGRIGKWLLIISPFAMLSEILLHQGVYSKAIIDPTVFLTIKPAGAYVYSLTTLVMAVVFVWRFSRKKTFTGK